MYKSCSRCGKIHDTKHKCNVGKKPVDYSRYNTPESRLRSTTAWTRKAIEIKEKAQYLCEVCRDNGVYNYAALEVHHIVKIRENKSLFLEDSNLICLCVECHKKADRGQIGRGYLAKLAELREQRAG